MTFKFDFIPATNKDGFSLGTFQGIDPKTGESPAKDRKTGEPLLDEHGQPIMRQWSLVSLLFEVKGVKRGTTKVFQLTTNGVLSPDGDMAVVLSKMGWVNETYTPEEDEDGLEILRLGEDDEDGLGVLDDDPEALIEMSVFDFVEATKGKQFWLKVVKDSKGYYRIEPNSLAPKV